VGAHTTTVCCVYSISNRKPNCQADLHSYWEADDDSDSVANDGSGTGAVAEAEFAAISSADSCANARSVDGSKPRTDSDSDIHYGNVFAFDFALNRSQRIAGYSANPIAHNSSHDAPNDPAIVDSVVDADLVAYSFASSEADEDGLFERKCFGFPEAQPVLRHAFGLFSRQLRFFRVFRSPPR
jgi:hypothetical protein